MSHSYSSRRVRGSVISSAVAGCFLEQLESRRLMAASVVKTVLAPSKTLANASPKIGDVLSYLASDFATRPAASQPRSSYQNKQYMLAGDQPNRKLLRTRGDSVLIKAVANAQGGNQLASQLAALGATVTGEYGVMVSAAVPVSLLAGVNNLSALNYADASYTPMTRAGMTDDLGVQSMNADKAARQYSVDGSGVRVGILSDSYNKTTARTAAQDIASGDLPAGGVTVVKDDPASGAADEGRGMAQIVHDVAPGAAISFYTADVSEADFASGILTLAKPTSAGGQGAQVVVDDVAYYDEPFFQDGIVAQAVNTAYTSYGTSYFSAAGNEGRQSYESTFTGVSATVTAGGGTGTFQDFDPSSATNVYQQITIPAGGEFFVVYQWDSPFASASANAGGSGGSSNSVSLYLLNSAKSSAVTKATTSRVGGDAYQILDYSNPSTSASTTVYLVAKVASGATPGYMKYIDEVGNNTIQYATNSGTTIGHAAAAGALGVGAAYYAQTPAFNVSPAVQEYYSSAGGTPIFFNPNGTRRATAENRQQPAIVAPDGAATTFFYGQETSTDGEYHFYGTSAAAPHAAAVAALLLQAKPSLTNAQVYSTLESTASDMSTSGYDYDTGYGLVQADKALAAVAFSNIGGSVFTDNNTNGVYDTGDTPIAGKTVFLDSNNNGLLDSGSATLSNTTATNITDATSTYNALSRVTSSIVSSVTGRVTGLTVSINAAHARFSDLGFTLITPSRVRIPLLTNLGGLSANVGQGINATLSDSSAAYIQGYSSSTTLSGTFKPQTPLAAAINESAAGTWQLEVRDYKSGSTGTLNSWSLNLTYADLSTSTDNSGNYSFSGLTPSTFFGTYRVRTGAISAYGQTTPNGSYDLTLPRSTTIDNEFFGFSLTPLINSMTFNYATSPNTITVAFNKDVSGSLASSDLMVSQVSGRSVAVTYASYNTATNTATFTLPTLPNGNYTASLASSAVTDALGQALASNGSLTFFSLQGDINRDGKVDIVDLGILSGNWQKTSAAYSQGDINGDGKVDIVDLGILSGNWQATV